ncbi:MAG: ABC transporter permease subunit [Phycisphaeraceae bacterium]|nr:ABC transporter permease subunit [Phycisphaeraceae bacterium]
MPVISKVGQKSWGVRIVIGTIYTLLTIGAVSMIYPLMLMLSGSVKSQTDFTWITPIPRYFFDDNVLWMKYLESKYGIVEAEIAHDRNYGSYRKITTPELSAEARELAELFDEFRREYDCPLQWYTLGHLQQIGQNDRAYRRLAQQKYDGSILAYSDAVGARYKTWSQVLAPTEAILTRRFYFPDSANYQLFNELKQQSLPADRIWANPSGFFWHEYLRLKWSRIEDYNHAHGTNYDSYQQVLLSTHPPEGGQERADWEDFVRYDLNTPFIRLNPEVEPKYQEFLEKRYEGDLDQLNRFWQKQYQQFSDIPLPQGVPLPSRAHLDYSEFLKNSEACPVEAMSIYGPRQAFEQFIAQKKGLAPGLVPPTPLPIAARDYLDFQNMTGALRWEFIKRNYAVVLDYILLHGNGVRNTVIYCGLMILVTLTVNPLAAYALSRYKPPSAYKILLFCMCTMAFPPEVTMIPAFLLLKRFPAIGLIFAVGVAAALVWVLHKTLPWVPDGIKGIAAGAIALVSGFWLLPSLIGQPHANVSLLNTFWALILPAAANGFGIFLLKGFFDSLPRELYESAEIDGAGEFVKFWTITMNLSKPILAVLALGAFTAAYSEFMMALVIIPDPEMWTLMVWLFQLNMTVPPYVGNAALVIAAIPTLLVFLFCQNIIMRGIVVPVEK